MKKKIFWMVTCVLFISAALYLRNQSEGLSDRSSTLLSRPTVSIGKHVFAVELAQSSEERQLGLGNRKNISDNAGMLFVFPERDRHSIWMRNMLFPLDIIWLNSADTKEGSLTVVDMRLEVSPETYPEAFLPMEDALYVLELPAGSAKKAGIGMGSVLTFRK